jgi:hypothetical protein
VFDTAPLILFKNQEREVVPTRAKFPFYLAWPKVRDYHAPNYELWNKGICPCCLYIGALRELCYFVLREPERLITRSRFQSIFQFMFSSTNSTFCNPLISRNRRIEGVLMIKIIYIILKNILWKNWHHKEYSRFASGSILNQPVRPWHLSGWELLSPRYCMKQMFI